MLLLLQQKSSQGFTVTTQTTHKALWRKTGHNIMPCLYLSPQKHLLKARNWKANSLSCLGSSPLGCQGLSRPSSCLLVGDLNPNSTQHEYKYIQRYVCIYTISNNTPSVCIPHPFSLNFTHVLSKSLVFSSSLWSLSLCRSAPRPVPSTLLQVPLLLPFSSDYTLITNAT